NLRSPIVPGRQHGPARGGEVDERRRDPQTAEQRGRLTELEALARDGVIDALPLGRARVPRDAEAPHRSERERQARMRAAVDLLRVLVHGARRAPGLAAVRGVRDDDVANVVVVDVTPRDVDVLSGNGKRGPAARAGLRRDDDTGLEAAAAVSRACDTDLR